MAAPRRIELVQAPVNSSIQPGSKSDAKPKLPNQPKKEMIAVRFEIKLQESTDDFCPEISYTDLLLQHERKRAKSKHSKSLNTENSFNDPFGDDHSADIEMLAKQLEEKYGKSCGGGTGRSMDLGEGYDSDDSFIDNDEAYDELVPSTLTTKFGGFYINSGLLDFKEVSDDEIISEQEVKKKVNKNVTKRRIISSDEESTASRLSKTKKTSTKQLTSKKKVKDAQQRLIAAKKRKLLSNSSNESDKDRFKQNDLKKKKLIEGAPPTLSHKELDKKGKQYDSIIDDVLKATKSSAPRDPAAICKTSTSTAIQSKTAESSAETKPKEPVKLPENLPENLTALIQKFKQSLSTCSEEKNKFFTPELTEELLILDSEIRLQTSQTLRSNLYSYISQYMPINRESLMKKMKQLHVRKLHVKLADPLGELKKGIELEMPAQIEQHNTEVQLKQQAKLEVIEGHDKNTLCQQDEGRDTQDSEEDADGMTSNNTASAINETDTGDGTCQTVSTATSKKRKDTVRKKYSWSAKIRELLCTVVSIRMSYYELIKLKGQTAEDFLREFLDSDVRVLWPKGWMQWRVLFRASRSAHCKWTSPQQHTNNQPASTKTTLTTMKATMKKAPMMASTLKMAAGMPNKSISSAASKQSGNALAASKQSASFVTGKQPASSMTATKQNPPSKGADGKQSPKVVSQSESKPTLQSLLKSNQTVVQVDSGDGSCKPVIITASDGSEVTLIPTSGLPTMATGKVSHTRRLDPDTLVKVSMIKSSSKNVETAGIAPTNQLQSPTLVTPSNETQNQSQTPDSKEKKKSQVVMHTYGKHNRGYSSDDVHIVHNNSNLVSSPRGSQSTHAGQTTHLVTPVTNSSGHLPSPQTSHSPGQVHTTLSDNQVIQLQTQQTHHRYVEHQKMTEQTKAVAAQAVLQTAEVLKQQHLAASMASHKAMLQHKKYAESLAEQSNLAKQQQIAAIAKEQTLQSNMAAQKRMLHHHQIAAQQTMERIKQTAQKQVAYQQAVHIHQRSDAMGGSSSRLSSHTTQQHTTNLPAYMNNPSLHTTSSSNTNRSPVRTLIPSSNPSLYSVYTPSQSPSQSWPAHLTPQQLAEYQKKLEQQARIENLKRE